MYVLSIDTVHDKDWTVVLRDFDTTNAEITSVSCDILSDTSDTETVMVKTRSKTNYTAILLGIKNNPFIRRIDLEYSMNSGYRQYHYLRLIAKSDISIIKLFSKTKCIFLRAKYDRGLEHWRFLGRKEQAKELVERVGAISTITHSEINLASPDTLETGMPMNLSSRELQSLTTSYRMGYFDFPRKCTLFDVSEELSISKGTLNEYLRKGMHKLLTKELATC